MLFAFGAFGMFRQNVWWFSFFLPNFTDSRVWKLFLEINFFYLLDTCVVCVSLVMVRLHLELKHFNMALVLGKATIKDFDGSHYTACSHTHLNS